MVRTCLVECGTVRRLTKTLFIDYLRYGIDRVSVFAVYFFVFTMIVLGSFISTPLYADPTPPPADLPPASNPVPDAQQVLNNIADQIPALTGLVYAIVYILGVMFIIGGLFKLKHVGEQRSMMSGHHGVAGAFVYLAIGALLLFLPSTLEVGTSTFWSTPCSYCYPTPADSAFTPVFKVVYAVVNFVGLIAFVRGLVLLSHTGQQSQHGGFAKAITHIIGGIFCMNIGAFVQMVFATLGVKL